MNLEVFGGCCRCLRASHAPAHLPTLARPTGPAAWSRSMPASASSPPKSTSSPRTASGMGRMPPACRPSSASPPSSSRLTSRRPAWVSGTAARATKTPHFMCRLGLRPRGSTRLLPRKTILEECTLPSATSLFTHKFVPLLADVAGPVALPLSGAKKHSEDTTSPAFNLFSHLRPGAKLSSSSPCCGTCDGDVTTTWPGSGTGEDVPSPCPAELIHPPRCRGRTQLPTICACFPNIPGKSLRSYWPALLLNPRLLL